MIIPLAFVATLAAHPHAGCDDAATPQCDMQLYHREEVEIVAVPRDFAAHTRARLVDGFGASQYAFFVQSKGERVPISRAQAAKLAGEKTMAKGWASANRWRVTPDAGTNGALSESLWARKLGVSSETARWAMLGRDAITYVAVPLYWGSTVQNNLAILFLAPSDDELLKSKHISVRAPKQD